MRRKLVRQGRNALTITVPKAWTAQHHLEAGDELDVSAQNNTLLLSTEKTRTQKKKVLDFREQGSRLAWRTIIAQYRAGYEEIEVYYDSDETAMRIQNVAKELIGFLIVKQTKNSFLLKDVAGVPPINFDTLLSRIFHILKSVLEEYARKELTKDDARDIDLSLNQYVEYCLRVLTIQGHSTPQKTAVLYSLIEQVEFTSDILQVIALKKRTKKFDQEWKNILGIIDSIYSCVFKYEMEKIGVLTHQVKTFEKQKRENDDSSYELVGEVFNNMITDIITIHAFDEE